ncbi:UNVERIFIED_CONTAM: hypothetical protein Sradi_1500400 [Sesamum radiatum]|uniref:Uncharacterized protein n=1 Tax=Sesamum radiatum TaxID=300843 RepID=A0AAW2U8I8_SESRA
MGYSRQRVGSRCCGGGLLETIEIGRKSCGGWISGGLGKLCYNWDEGGRCEGWCGCMFWVWGRESTVSGGAGDGRRKGVCRCGCGVMGERGCNMAEVVLLGWESC